MPSTWWSPCAAKAFGGGVSEDAGRSGPSIHRLRADALANLGFLADGQRARELLEQARELYTSYGHAADKLALIEQVLAEP
ncbi:MAG: hypothetical protein HC828_20365 [Blastochloris sp.]|nr:hypothetical protein [Blastochloris sp.]